MNQTENETPDGVYLRRGKNGGVYFFTPTGKTIFYTSGERVRMLIDGRADYAFMTKTRANTQHIEEGM